MVFYALPVLLVWILILGPWLLFFFSLLFSDFCFRDLPNVVDEAVPTSVE